MLHITMLQTDIVWENKQLNLLRLYQELKPLQGSTDIVVLPEMCTTGFSMNAKKLAESVGGDTITSLRQYAVELNLAIVGSFIAVDGGEYFNRGFFLTPENEAFFYDKRHLFRMGCESESFSSGSERLIVHYRGWNICLMICYDLRFPVWSRNVKNEYDLLIYCANWPASRSTVWDALLVARALENMCFVCGVNRIGTDGEGLLYTGGSKLISPTGKVLEVLGNTAQSVTTPIALEAVKTLREKFPVWLDADDFILNKC